MRVSLLINALKKPWIILLPLIIIGIVLCLILYFSPHHLERFVSLSYQAQLFKITFASTLILISGSLVFFTLSRLMRKEAYKANVDGNGTV